MTSSALPSRDRDRRIREAGVEAVSSIRSGHEAGWLAWELGHVSIASFSDAHNTYMGGVVNRGTG